LSPKIAAVTVRRNINKASSSVTSSSSLLTSREREILQLLAEGLTSKEIAHHVNLSMKTVEAHRRNIMQKLNMRSLAELTKYAVREGLVALEG